MAQKITLNVNGRTQQVEVEADTPLLYVLRNDLGLKAAKFACGTEQCGACKVIIDGYAVNSCRLPVRMMQGRQITTLEGLETNGKLHPLQQAFIDEQALQCGFCTAGMIVAAKALLDRKPNPTDDAIRSDLRLNLCRCGVYDRMLRAIRRVADGAADYPAYETISKAARAEPVWGPSDQSDLLPAALIGNPELDAWIRIDADETVTLFPGKVEFGQGILTPFAQIGAEELEVSLEKIRVATADTSDSPDMGLTVSSMSLQSSGNALRIAAAEARQIMLAIAFEDLEVPIERLVVSDGRISDPETGRSTTYWELMGGKRFGRKVTGTGQERPPKTYTVVGQPAPRLDLNAKVTGKPVFIHDLELSSMIHGRVVRPPRDGSFLAVVAEREDQAVKAMELLRDKAVWQGEANLPAYDTLHDNLVSQPHQSHLIVEGTPVEGAIPTIEAPANARTTLSADFYRPYQMHASLGASAAVAQMKDGEMTIWCHSQGVFPTRVRIAQVLGMAEETLRVIHVEGAGCYGHNGADDAALDAALLARAVPGRAVSLKWMRADEHAWEPYGPATAVKMQASLDAGGKVIDWNHDVWGYPHMGRGRPDPESSGMIAAWHLSKPFEQPVMQPSMGRHVGVHRNADPAARRPTLRAG
jgi:aerobic-type carbon monoxide dehydrogenase small subunit (CoxS/CutS family)